MRTQGSQAPLDYVVQFSKVVSSSISENPSTGESEGLLYNVAGIGTVDLSGDTPVAVTDDDLGEGNDTADVFGQLGVLGRPLPPEATSQGDRFADVVCVRTSEGLIPVAHRDTRLQMQGNGPGEGTIALIGYGGGFHSLDPVDSGDSGTIHTIYCPYDFSGGVAQKAHSIVIDPTSGNESISIVHADGMAITMLNDSKKALVMKNASGDATLRLDDDGITMTATTITLSGGVIVGEPLAAVPLLAGPASPGSTKFFVSP